MANEQEEIAKLQAKTTQRRREVFDALMQRPETKLMFSMVPATEPPELLVTLMRMAFDAGHAAGTGEILTQLTMAMIKSPKGGEL